MPPALARPHDRSGLSAVEAVNAPMASLRWSDRQQGLCEAFISNNQA